MAYTRYVDNFIESSVFTRHTSSLIKGKTLTLWIDCPAKDYEWAGFLISYNYKVESDREDYYVPATEIIKDGKHIRMCLKLNVAEFPFRRTHWSVRAVYNAGGETYASKILYTRENIGIFSFLFRKNNYRTSDGNILFEYKARGGYFGLRYREVSKYDGLRTRWKEALARTIYHFKKNKYAGENAFLIFEKRCEKAQDNGYYLFKYCVENNMEKYLNRKIYYVIEKGASDRKKLEKYSDNVLDFMSIKFMLRLLACRLLISSDARNHAYIWQNQPSLISDVIRKKKHVFLGHGVLAMKRLNASFMASNMKSEICTVTSEKEAEIFINDLGYKRHQTEITGYARFDALVDKSEGKREILIMPTHRSWLFGVERKVFVESEYYRRYMDIINSKELIDILEKEDINMSFYLHPSIGEHIDAFTSASDRISIVPYGIRPLDELMMESKLLITDYSSIAWDMYYMGKPVLLYQYDIPEYMETWGSYIDLEKESPGKRVDTYEGVIEAIREYIDKGYTLDDVNEEERLNMFAYTDDNNSKRICDTLKERGL